MFDEGRWWRANPPLSDGSGNPPKGWGNPITPGTMVLVREDLAVFRSQSGQVVEFVPWPPASFSLAYDSAPYRNLPGIEYLLNTEQIETWSRPKRSREIYRRGSTGSLSRASTAKAHSWTR